MNTKMQHTLAWISLFALVFVGLLTEHSRHPKNLDEFYAEVIQIAMEARVITDEKGQILYAAPSVEAIVGYAPAELLGKSVELIIPDRYLVQHSGKIKAAIIRNDGTIVSTKCYAKKKDNSEELIEIRTRVVNTGSGKVILATLTPASKIEVLPNGK